MASKASETPAAPAPEQSKPVIADESTQTVYGVTLAELLSQHAREMENKDAAIRSLEAKVTELEAKVQTAADSLALIAELRTYRTLTRLPNGNIRLPIELDKDAAVRYLSQAEDAQEDPQEYIQKNVEEALNAFA